MNLKPPDAQYINPNGFDLKYYRFEAEQLMVFDPKKDEWVKTPLNKQIVLTRFKRI